ncbi:MAG: tetratricopeptide repeat protein [Candidatus Cloacimonadota bacterium]|nr:tetratricopeptide repeat protein [Candidatus Cloacimonadota bacterium]
MKNCYRYLIILFVIFFNDFAFAGPEMDSLKKILSSESGDDGIVHMTTFFRNLRNEDPQKCLECENLALSIVKEFDENSSIKGHIYKNMGLTYVELCDYQKAIKFDILALEIFKGMADKKETAKMYNNLGIAYKKFSKFDKALECYNISFDLKKKIGKEQDLITNYINIAALYIKLGKFDNSMELLEIAEIIAKKYHSKHKYLIPIYIGLANIMKAQSRYEDAISYSIRALSLADSLGQDKNIAIVRNNIANLNKELEYYDHAMEYYEMALEKFVELGDKRHSAGVIYNIANIYRHNKEYTKAMESFNEALQCSRELGDKHFTAIVLHNMGVCKNYQNKKKEALDYYFQSLAIMQKFNLRTILATNLKNIGSVYSDLGNYNKALEYLNWSLKIADELDLRDVKKEGYKLLSNLFSKKEQFQEAWDFQKKYIAVKDSILDEDKVKQISEIQTKYETEKKEKEIAILKHEKEIQKINLEKGKLRRRIYFLFAIVLFFIVIIIFYFYRIKRKLSEKLENDVNQRTKELASSNKNLREEIIERQKIESRLRISERISFLGELAGGIAHKIRSPLTVIKSSAQFCRMKFGQDEQELSEMLQTIADSTDKADEIIVSLLQFANPDNNPKKEEEIINVLEKICKLTAGLRSNNNIVLVKKISNDIPAIKFDTNQMEILFMNLIINAISSMGDFGTLTVTAKYENHEIVMSIQDTGEGIPPENLSRIFESFFTTKEKGTGLGLSLAQEIVESNGGKINVLSEVGTGTVFNIVFPVSQINESEV